MPSKITKHVAIIGAGVSGVVTAAHLKNEGLNVTVFERFSAAGGVWLYDDRKPPEPTYPSILASQAENHYSNASLKESEKHPIDPELLHAPPGPCYVGLKNNVGTRLLQTTLNQFPAGTPDFVSHTVLRDYIRDTAVKTGIHDHTIYDTKVKHIEKQGSKWHLEATTVRSGLKTEIVEDFDAVVVASGHYHAPVIPDIEGLADWKRQWPDRIQHSKSYRRPEDYKGKNFLLIGGSVSATDIARELGPVATTIYQSHRNGTFDLPASLLPENTIRVDEVSSFSVPSSSTTTTATSLPETSPIPSTIHLKSGRKICNIDHIILCTGYHVTLPFLPNLHSDTTPVTTTDETVLVTNGTQIHNLHKDIFYIKDPTLCFVGVPYFTATFTLFEFQAMVVAKVLSGLAKTPSEEDMRTEYVERVKRKGYGKAFHSLRDEEVDYVDELMAWVNRDLEKEGRPIVKGHTEAWKIAKEEQVARLKEMFSGDAGPEKELVGTCW